jgi:hypothetical protein
MAPKKAAAKEEGSTALPAAPPKPRTLKRVNSEATNASAAALEANAGEAERPRKKGKKYPHCLICGCDAEGNLFASSRCVRGVMVSEGPGCMECYKTWVKGCFNLTLAEETFDGFCVRCSQDQALKDKVTAATAARVQPPMERQLLPSEVSGHILIGYTAKTAFIGITPKSFFCQVQENTRISWD